MRVHCLPSRRGNRESLTSHMVTKPLNSGPPQPNTHLFLHISICQPPALGNIQRKGGREGGRKEGRQKREGERERGKERMHDKGNVAKC